MLDQRLRRWSNIEPTLDKCTMLERSPPAQQTQHICITFIQRRPNVFDVGPTLYEVIQMFCVHWVSIQVWGEPVSTSPRPSRGQGKGL